MFSTDSAFVGLIALSLVAAIQCFLQIFSGHTHPNPTHPLQPGMPEGQRYLPQWENCRGSSKNRAWLARGQTWPTPKKAPCELSVGEGVVVCTGRLETAAGLTVVQMV